MKRCIPLFLAVLALFGAAGCSVVFTGSITGELHDRDTFDDGQAGSGISDGAVYLYTEEDTWAEDLAAWAGGTGPLPDVPEDAEGTVIDPRYFLKTVTGTDGAFTFNGFIWEDLFPQYGKSGDRKEIFLLYHQRDYGLTGNETPVYIVSNVTNRLPPTTLERIYNRATIQGDIIDSDDGEPLANVNVRVYIPADWTYDASGNITVTGWNSDPDYLVTTDAAGRYEREISYPMKPDTETNVGTTLIRLTFGRNGYIAENSADADMTDGGWDADGDGTIEEGEDEAYYQSPVIEADTTVEMAEIALAPELNSATITGTVEDAASGDGVGNVNVDIYVPESWDYNETTDAFENPVWPEEPSYSLVTNAAGDYTAQIEFAREPELTDNRGTVKVRVVFNRNGYETSDSIDTDIIDGDPDGEGDMDEAAVNWDIDADGSISEEERYYYESDIITDGRSETLATIDLQRTEFSATVEGRIWANGAVGTTAVNGTEIRIYIDEPPTPLDTDWDKRAYTQAQVITEQDVRDGYYDFSGINFNQDSTTFQTSGQQVYITCFIGVEDEDGSFTLYEVQVYSDSENYFEYEQNL